MTRIFLLFSIIAIVLTSCDKSVPVKGACTYTNSSNKATAAEIAYIQNYLTTNGLTAIQDTSGFFYSISANGSGTSPVICSTILVQYTGWLFNGFKFDESTGGSQFKLGAVIVGWQKGLPLIQPGGIITLYIPPSLAYGAVASGNIPANAYLKFYIKLVAVQ